MSDMVTVNDKSIHTHTAVRYQLRHDAPVHDIGDVVNFETGGLGGLYVFARYSLPDGDMVYWAHPFRIDSVEGSTWQE